MTNLHIGCCSKQRFFVSSVLGGLACTGNIYTGLSVHESGNHQTQNGVQC